MVQTSKLLLLSFSTLLISPSSCRVDHQLNCVKGGGACHLREKVLAEAANTYVSFCLKFSSAKPIFSASFSSQIIGKTCSILALMYLFPLGYRQSWNNFSSKFTQGVPIEVVPFAYAKVLQNLHHILGSPKATLRMALKKGKLKINIPCSLLESHLASWTRCHGQWKLYHRCSF